ncbi:MAG TPA: hypothetical protein VEO02_08865 [Thermoanaerobaculia bacterium]|nr:hypothetical protein [Thermoanaerobaculia bacterium]
MSWTPTSGARRPGPDSPEAPRFEEPLLLRIFYSKDVRENWGEKLHDRS